MAQVLKNLPASAGDREDVGLIPRLGRSSQGGNGNPFQFPCLENHMDRGAWRATGHRVTKIRSLNTRAGAQMLLYCGFDLYFSNN